ncbi:hypothetical protein M8818_001995 [Zalaria obscura]|uniref:Uncharacterized protein n=1 Tax=Zalaria obscura TaxID=2024903 RepID=A0ACC3SJR2_9PEZI
MDPLYANPTNTPSNYLLDRLQERRAASKRSRRSDFGPLPRNSDDDIFLAEAEAERQYDSSPMTATASKRLARSGLAVSMRSDSDTESGVSRKSMGARQTEEKLEKLNKENFDLKLELFHLRKKTASVQLANEKLLGRAEMAEKTNREAVAIQEELVAELEKRDRAVEEAVGIICAHEATIEEMRGKMVQLMEDLGGDTGYCGSEVLELVQQPSSPPDLPSTLASTILPKTGLHVPERHCPPAASALQSRRIGSLQRTPSFLLDKQPSTQALRAVFLAETRELQTVKSFNSLRSRIETDDGHDKGLDVLMSPRLSVLSESSFPSIYNRSPRKGDDTKEEEPRQEFEMGREREVEEEERVIEGRYTREDSITRVNQWIESASPRSTPSKSQQLLKPLSPRLQHRSPLQQTDHQSHQSQSYHSVETALAPPASLHPQPNISAHRTGMQHQQQQQQQQPKTPLEAPQFASPLMPPTPDTVSTRMLRRSRESIDKTSQRSQDQNTHAPQTELIYQPQARLQEEEDTESTTPNPDYAGYPTGGSIITGTPSRFHIQHTETPATNILFDGEGIDDLPLPTSRPHPGRRNSDVPLHVSPRARPEMNRAETTPISPEWVNGGRTLPELAREREVGSGIGSPRTPGRLPVSASTNALLSPSQQTSSPGLSIRTKTQKLFRRLSAGHGSSPARESITTQPARAPPLSPQYAKMTGVTAVTAATAAQEAMSRAERRPRSSYASTRPDTSRRQSLDAVVMLGGARRQSVDVGPVEGRGVFGRMGSLRKAGGGRMSMGGACEGFGKGEKERKVKRVWRG